MYMCIPVLSSGKEAYTTAINEPVSILWRSVSLHKFPTHKYFMHTACSDGMREQITVNNWSEEKLNTDIQNIIDNNLLSQIGSCWLQFPLAWHVRIGTPISR